MASALRHRNTDSAENIESEFANSTTLQLQFTVGYLASDFTPQFIERPTHTTINIG